MIQHLLVKHFALINSCEIDFQKGFNVITGETGAGKSILLDALSLLNGNRAESHFIQSGKSKAIVEGTFSQIGKECNNLLVSLDIEPTDELIIRREISTSGNNRVFINDSQVKLSDLKLFSGLLFKIHGQHHTLSIVQGEAKVKLLDGLVSTKTKQQFQTAYQAYATAKTELSKEQAQFNKIQKERDYNNFLLQEFQEIQFSDIDYPLLKKNISEVDFIEQINQVVQETEAIAHNEDYGVISLIGKIKTLCASLPNELENFNNLTERLNSVGLEVEDIIGEIIEQKPQEDLDEDEILVMKDKFDKVEGLMHKHKAEDFEELYSIYEDLEQKTSNTEALEKKIKALEVAVENKFQLASEKANDLHAERSKVAQTFSHSVIKILQSLAIPDVRLETKVEKTSQLTEYGWDEVQFLFQANLGSDLFPIEQIASGGELSRFALAAQTVIAKSNNTPLIFDEIDTGVSGRVALGFGKLFKEIGKEKQVMSITHLPQVAAKSDAHFKVYKDTVDSITHTHIEQLTGDTIMKEIAILLSGNEISESSIQSAKELIHG